MSVAIIVPWRGGCEHRERAWAWVRARYAERHPDWSVVVAECGPGPWVKARAVMPAIEASDAEIVVVGDADIWHENLKAAVEAVRDGAPWAIPHRGVFRLSEQGTAELLAGAEDFERLDLDRPAYLGVEGGGYVIARRQTLLDVPLDPRFVGWGQEDLSLALALNTLIGPLWRGKGPLVHLYHPLQERLTNRVGSMEGRALWKRYITARRKPELMLALIEEAHAARATLESNVLGHDALSVG